ncbi:MAG: Mu transposase C-terminal domain-containing protein [Verrucomicrobiota bacterium]
MYDQSITHRSFQPEQDKPEPQTDRPMRTKRINRCPAEELDYRCERDGAPEPIPVDLVALILAKTARIMVTRNGIKLEYHSVKYQFWHPNAVTCQPANVGKKVSFTFDPDDMTQIHILDDKGRYVESIPQKSMPQFFSKEMSEELKAHREYIDGVHEQVAKIHQEDTEEAIDRTRRNAEALQAVNTFPIERDGQASARESADLPEAAALNGKISEAKDRVAKRKQRSRGNDSAVEQAARGLDFSDESFAEITREETNHSNPEDDVEFEAIRDVLSDNKEDLW